MQLHAIADLEAADHVEQRLQRHALGVEEQLERLCCAVPTGLGGFCFAAARARLVLGVECQDAQVSEHLALVREKGRVAAFPATQVGELVRHLAVEELDGLRAGQDQLAPLGAVHETARALQRGVVIGERGRSGLHVCGAES